jgi:hypothetical protein
MTTTKSSHSKASETSFDNFNLINLVGRVGQDPETQYFPSGSCLTKLSIAVNRPQKDAEPDWFSLEVWERQEFRTSGVQEFRSLELLKTPPLLVSLSPHPS